MKSLALAVSLVLSAGLRAAEPAVWNQFRGPNGSGVAVGCRPPIQIGPEVLVWKRSIPSGLSAPVIWDDLIFLTGMDAGRLVTIGINRVDGSEAWRVPAPEVRIEKVHKANHPAAPTPLVDADRLYVYFGSYGLLCYDHAGKELWRRAIPTPRTLYGVATSPVAHGKNLILILDDDRNLPDSKLSRSKLAAFRKEDGAVVWETERPLQRSSWSTPTVFRYEGGEDLVVLGAGRVCGYDPRTGAEKWFATGFSRETIAVPVAGKEEVYVSSAQLGGGADDKVDPEPFWAAVLRFDQNGDGKLARDEITEQFTWILRPELPLGHPGFGIPLPRQPDERRKRQEGIFGWVDADKDGFWTKEEYAGHLAGRKGRPLLMAIRPGGTGNVTESHVSWELNRSIPEVPSPIYYENRIYLARNGGTLAAVDAASGKPLYRGRLAGRGGYSASPVAASGRLYLLSDDGVISVVRSGGEFELVHHHELSEPASVTPAIDVDTLYVRGEKHLWAFREK